jgi:hypothetical protein
MFDAQTMEEHMALEALAIMVATLQIPVDGAPQMGAPAAPPGARYCLRVDPTVGSRMETIRCETRADWAAMEVDVDAEWARWGVRVVTATPGYGV